MEQELHVASAVPPATTSQSTWRSDEQKKRQPSKAQTVTLLALPPPSAIYAPKLYLGSAGMHPHAHLRAGSFPRALLRSTPTLLPPLEALCLDGDAPCSTLHSGARALSMSTEEPLAHGSSAARAAAPAEATAGKEKRRGERE
jgi:hypothetical protein